MSIQPTFYKFFPTDDQGKTENLNDRINDETRDIVKQLNLSTSTQPIEETQLIDNSLFLGSGTYGGFTLNNPNTRIGSVVDVVVNSDVVINSSNCQVSGVHFKGWVLVEDGASVVFENCVFDNSVTGGFQGVTFRDTSFGHFIGCTFLNDTAAFNFGAAANVYIIGCIKQNVLPTHVLVTVIAQTQMP